MYCSKTLISIRVFTWSLSSHDKVTQIHTKWYSYCKHHKINKIYHNPWTNVWIVENKSCYCILLGSNQKDKMNRLNLYTKCNISLTSKWDQMRYLKPLFDSTFLVFHSHWQRIQLRFSFTSTHRFIVLQRNYVRFRWFVIITIIVRPEIMCDILYLNHELLLSLPLLLVLVFEWKRYRIVVVYILMS